MTTSDRYLALLREKTSSYIGEVHRLTEGLDEDQLAWATEPGRWSMAQCFEHLVVAAALYYPGIMAAIESHRSPSAGAVAYRSTWIGRKVVDAMRDTAGRRRFKAPRSFRPASQPAPGSTERLVASIEELNVLIERAAGADIVRAKVASPVIPLLRLNLGEALELQVVHIARHLAQARRVREHADFPSGARQT